MVIVLDVGSVPLFFFAQQISQSISTAGIMRKGCEITVCCSSIFLLYRAVNNAGVMILKILL
jgi:hypothetical protein